MTANPSSSIAPFNADIGMVCIAFHLEVTADTVGGSL